MVLKFKDHPQDEEKKEVKTKSKGKVQDNSKSERKEKVKAFTTAQKWWSKASIKYAFSHPYVTSRLEKLMGSNLVCLTDREYMQKLQERILEDYAESMEKRIKVRENEEMERVKNLVLSGRIPLNEAPESMADHPIMLIERHCKKLIAQRRAKIKIPRVHIPTHLYSDDTPDPPSGLSIENGHVFRKPYDRLCNPVSKFLPPEEFPFDPDAEDYDSDDEREEEYLEDEQEPEEKLEQEGMDNPMYETIPEEVGEEEVEEEEIIDEFMFSKTEFDRLKYESPLIKQLRQCQTVEELYELADQIIGILKALDPTDLPIRTTSDDTVFSQPVAPQDDSEVKSETMSLKENAE